MSLKVLLSIAASIGEAIRCNYRISHELHSYRAHKGFVLSFYKLSSFHVEQQWQEAREERLAILSHHHSSPRGPLALDLFACVGLEYFEPCAASCCRRLSRTQTGASRHAKLPASRPAPTERGAARARSRALCRCLGHAICAPTVASRTRPAKSRGRRGFVSPRSCLACCSAFRP